MWQLRDVVGTGDQKGRLLDLRSGASTHILTGEDL